MLLSTPSRSFPRSLRMINRLNGISGINGINRASCIRRAISTLKENPHIYIHPTPSTSPQTYTLSLLPTSPPHPSLSLGTTTSPPPSPITPSTFTPNPYFLPLLSKVLFQYAHLDPQLQSQAAAFATTSSHFSLSPPSTYRASGKGKMRDSGAPPSAIQGGAGSSGRGGYIHLSDTRAPPDYGRIAYPEDIFGSLEVTCTGDFVEGDAGKQPGNWQDSGTYRIVTREGVFGLTDFLRGKLVEVLKEEEKKIKGGS